MSAPTGAGKSVTFELAPFAFHRLLGKDCNAIVFVISPLISWHHSAFVATGDNRFLNLRYKLVFGIPEAILNNYRHIFRRLKQIILKCVFIDESHCITK